jgi:CRP-like cAMP-binding protein
VQEIVRILGSTAPFQGGSTKHLCLLAEGAELVDLARDVRFITAGDPPARVDLLVEGMVRVFHEHESGRRVTVKHIGAPATLGEMQAMAGLAFIENAETLTPARLVRLETGAFKRYLELDHRATLQIFSDVCARFCVAARNERAILFEVPARLAGLILTYADLFGRQTEEGLLIRYPLTQRSLADSLGVVERSVRRAFSEWRKAGVLEVKKGWLVIRDLPTLEKTSGELRFSINYRSGIDVERMRQRED